MSLGQRIAVAALGLSAAGLVGIAHYEGYSDRAISPVPGDVPTIGFGSTRHADGRPVKLGETIPPPKALALAARDVAVKEGELKRCLRICKQSDYLIKDIDLLGALRALPHERLSFIAVVPQLVGLGFVL